MSTAPCPWKQLNAAWRVHVPLFANVQVSMPWNLLHRPRSISARRKHAPVVPFDGVRPKWGSHGTLRTNRVLEPRSGALMGHCGHSTPSNHSAPASTTTAAHLHVQHLLLVVRAAVGVLTERVPRHHRAAQFQTLVAAAAAPGPQRGHPETIRPPEDGLRAQGRSTEQQHHHREQLCRCGPACTPATGAAAAAPVI